MKRNTKEIWIKEGLKVLVEKGNSALTIDVLTRRLHVTKGSFYHHFKNRKAYSEALLSYWEEQMTRDIIKISKSGTSFEDKNTLLFDASSKVRNARLEVAIRSWALRDELARSFQERVDKQRMEYINELYQMIIQDKKKAKDLTMIRYAFFIGAQQIIPSIQGKELTRLFNALHELLLRKNL